MFTLRFIELSSRDRRVTTTYSSSIQQTISENHRESHSDVPTDHLKRNEQTEHLTAQNERR